MIVIVRRGIFCPVGLARRSRADGCLFAEAPASSGADVGNLLDVQLIEAADISNAIAWLVSDQARCVTGAALPVDAGFTARWRTTLPC
jgi:NAD(P)-dependent dehydrogenase (short-subunit alcohol dehydrogenase family)